MKKILGILGAIGMTAGTAATVVACGNPTETEKPETIADKLDMETLIKLSDNMPKFVDIKNWKEFNLIILTQDTVNDKLVEVKLLNTTLMVKILDSDIDWDSTEFQLRVVKTDNTIFNEVITIVKE